MSAGLKYAEGIAVDETSIPTVIARLIALHNENQEIARLVTLRGRAFYSSIAFLTCAGGALALFHIWGAATDAWILLMVVVIAAQARAYFLAYHGLLSIQALKSFEADFEKVQLMSGFAWGAGAFLATSALTPAAAINLFAIAPSVIIAVLLRSRRSVLLFIAPVAAFSALVCIARAENLTGGLFVLLGCAAAAALAGIADRGPIKFPLATLALTSRVFSAVTQR